MPRALSRAAALAAALALSLATPSLVLAEENRPPDRPDAATLTADHEPCSTDRDAPTLLNSTELTLSGVFSDPDREFGSTRVKGQFEWTLDGEETPIGTAETNPISQGPDIDPIARWVTASDLPEEVLFSYRARAHDTETAGEWSERCWVEVSTSRPQSPPVVASEDYPDDDRFHGGIGESGEFTFNANGVEDVVAYDYGFFDCSTRVETKVPGGEVTVTITPERDGPLPLYIRSVDPYGNTSGCQSAYTVRVASPSGPVAIFALDEGEGDTAQDGVRGSERTATAARPLEWIRGRVGDDPGTGHYRREGTAADVTGNPLRTAGPVVDTSGAFTLSVWTRLDDTSADGVLLSQEGDFTSGFQLGFDADEGRWAFRQSAGDTPGARFIHRVLSDEPARTHVWTQLLVTQDPETGRTELYVDGVHQGGIDHVSAWHPEGAFVIGGGLAPRRTELGWSGSVDDVVVWDRALRDEVWYDTRTGRSEVWEQANRPLVSGGGWQLEETEGETAADGTDHGLDATLHGDPDTVWNSGDWLDPSGVLLNDELSEHLRTDGPAVETGHSFTVSAVVQLDDLSQDAVAVSQRGEHASAFSLGYDADSGHWVFETAAEDAPDTRVHRVASDAPAREGEQVHLVGVYDHTDGTLTLYVRDPYTSVTTADAGPAWNADGDVLIGATATGDGADRYWSGRLHLVQVLQGVPTEADLSHLGWALA
ncbi:LamG domain-containing protein [Nocardiopsis sp. EMB25]|uniref:LamG domain-containing protein n=1 Tax=Nocardiopsis sp. EMB25 TaxID=2835867 RepID=UPI0022846B4E|nr:LamG domain-containing protein [Nocardiopsis sp. EMB25]MCY9784022.1 LamG domain-containing protein [Nocardiopsis sp. EMB25]